MVLGIAAAAATALWVRHKTRQVERDHPATGRFVEVDGVRLHYIERGEGSPVVLLHGNGMLEQDFEGSGLIDLLAARHRVIVFDRPGYGYSERPRNRIWTAKAQAALLHRAVAALGLESPVVVGHSWGTIVATAWALDFPADVRGLVLLSGYYYPTIRPDVALFSPPAIPIIGDVMRYTVSALFARAVLPALVKNMFAPRPVSPRFFGAIPRELLLRPSQIRASAGEAALLIPEAVALKKRYKELRMPVHLFAGTADRVVFPKKQSIRLHKEVPHSTLTLVPEVGHMVHFFAAEKIAAAVDEIVHAGETSEIILLAKAA
jgi:pimeloyl-ACP methyl ester carboxylesterase